MAGLLDSSLDTSSLSGLLSQIQQAGAPSDEDRASARSRALMAMGLALMGAPKGQEFSRLGQAGLLGMQDYQKTLQQGAAQRHQSLGDAASTLQLMQMLRSQRAQDAYAQALPGVLGAQPSPMQGAMANAPSLSPTNANVASVQGAAQATQAPGPYERLMAQADALEAQARQQKDGATAMLFLTNAQKMREEALKFAPKYGKLETVMQGGKPTLLQMYDNRAPAPLQGFQPKPDFKQVDTGNAIGFYDPLTQQQSGTFTKQLTPGEAADIPFKQGNLDVAQGNLAVSRGNLGVSQQRLGIERGNQDLRRQELDPFGTLGVNPNAPKGASMTQGTHGDEYLSTLPQAVAAQVKALAEGRQAFPTGYALRSPMMQNLIAMVSQYDPSFDAVNYGARSKTRNDFTAGKSANSINALNTVIGHLGQLSDAADALHNTSLPILNTATNFLATQTGDPRIKNFDATKKAVVDELTRVYRGTGGSESDIKTWSTQLDAAGSPEQLHSVISQIGGLLESKINALKEQYSQGMGTTAQGIRLLTPHARDALTRMEARAGGAPDAAPAPASGGGKVIDFSALPK